MKAGLMDRRITIERYTTGTDEYGDPVQGWAAHATVWASQRPGGGSERFANAEVAASVPMVFRIRYSAAVADVNPKDRISYAGKVWDIAAVAEVGRRAGFDITATTGAD